MPTTFLSSPQSFCNLLSLAEFPDSFQAAAFSIYRSRERKKLLHYIKVMTLKGMGLPSPQAIAKESSFILIKCLTLCKFASQKQWDIFSQINVYLAFNL